MHLLNIKTAFSERHPKGALAFYTASRAGAKANLGSLAHCLVTMKVRPRRQFFLILLLSALSPSHAESSIHINQPILGHFAVRDSSALTPNPDQAAGVTLSNPVGTKDAPIDGKDGKPHSGPFVETEAERDRKKAKDTPDEEPAVMPSTGPSKEQTNVRQSNDGVMDDPNRSGPKDGTRGTEGGMSEKFKEEKTGEEKKPDPPKEAPPLPHSEQEMMKDPQDKDPGNDLEAEKKLLEVVSINSVPGFN